MHPTTGRIHKAYKGTFPERDTRRQLVISGVPTMCNRNSLSQLLGVRPDCALWQKAQSQELVSEGRGGHGHA